ncbi:MAG: dockerin type I domain-containing protein [Aureliella sp.]
MKKRRAKSLWLQRADQQRGSARANLRLVLEPLECRRLLAGINVSVLVDGDSENAAAGRLVYLDTNRNQTLDGDEQVRITDDAGNALFESLQPGDYSVGLLAGSGAQEQVSPSRVAPSATKLSDAGGSFVLATADRSRVWTLDASGVFTPVVGGEPVFADPELAARPVSVEQLSDEVAWIVSESSAGDQTAWLFTLETGELVPYSSSGLPDGTSISKLVRTSDGIAALVTSGDANYLTSGSLIGNELQFQSSTTTSATKLHAIADSPYVLAVDSESASADRISIVDPKTGQAQGETHTLSGIVLDITPNHSGSQAIAVLEGGGAEVLDLDSGVKLTAILSEAHTPASFSGNDAYVVTSDRDGPNRLVVWDTTNWLPVGRTTIESNESVAGLQELPSGDLLAVGTGGLHSLSIDAAANIPVVVEDEIVEVEFGISVEQGNSPPTAGPITKRVLDEDTTDLWDLSTESAFDDADGDRLWFSIGTPPAHGELTLDAGGRWQYAPDENYFGEDSATIRLHDGIDSTEVSINLTVQPVNDLPERMFFDIPPIAESTQPGELVGYVSIVDVDRDAVYEVTTSDARFAVTDGRVYLASGDLDYESARELAIDFLATDVSDERIKIGTTTTLAIADVNEPPTDLSIDGNSVPEHDAGATVGTVTVIDPDSVQQFELSVSDSRFEIVDQVLKLRDGQELDRETQPEVAVDITAVDQQNPAHSITNTVTITVSDRNEPPGDLTLSRHAVDEDFPGATVGTLFIADPDDEVYQFTVSDDRFEISGDQLQLRENVSLSRDTQQFVGLSVTASAASGDTKTETFQIEVLEFSSHQNPRLQYDVNGDGQVTPLDVLILVNLLNQEDYELPPPAIGGGSGEPGSVIYPDVNGDNELTPLDVLIIVNYLNGNRDSSGGEGEAMDALVAPQLEPVYGPQLPDSFDRFQTEREERRRLDAELESLANQLSIGR